MPTLPARRYMPPPMHSRGRGSIADLLMQRGDIAARGAERSGQIWGGAVQGLGQLAGQAIGQYAQHQEQEAAVAQEQEERQRQGAMFDEVLGQVDWTKPEEAIQALVPIVGVEAGTRLVSTVASVQKTQRGQQPTMDDAKLQVGTVADMLERFGPEYLAERWNVYGPALAPIAPLLGLESIPKQFTQEVAEAIPILNQQLNPTKGATARAPLTGEAGYIAGKHPEGATPEEMLAGRREWGAAGRAPQKPEGWEANPYLRDVDWSLQGRELLESLHPSIAGPVRQTAFHELPYSAAGRGKEMRQAILALAPAVNPEWSQHTYTVAREFAKGQPAKARRAINNALADASLAFKQSAEFERTDFPWVNKGTAWFYEQTGRPEEMVLRGTLKNLATEFALASKNGLAPMEREIEEFYERYASTTSPAQLNAMVRNDIEFTVNRLVTLENDWERYFGEQPTTPFLNRQTLEKAKKHGFLDILQASGIYLGEGAAPAGAAGGEGTQTIGRFTVQVEE